MNCLRTILAMVVAFNGAIFAHGSNTITFNTQQTVELQYLESDSLSSISKDIDGRFCFKNNKNEYPKSDFNPYKFNGKQLIAPGVLIGVGSLGLTNWWKNHVNKPVKKFFKGGEHHVLGFDDYIMFAPAVAGYGMNLFGFKGKHNIVDATIIYGTTYILVAATALPLKSAIHSERPNSKNFHSFPSAHTAIAFAGAELLRREYRDVSPWIGVGGYAVAALTGLMRIYNNAHWLNDVLAGAGLGILCAEAAYWLYPVITKTFFKKRYKANIFLSPTAGVSNVGVACYIAF